MGPDSLVAFAAQHVTTYVTTLTATLFTPGTYFTELYQLEDTRIVGTHSVGKPAFDPRLFTFVVLSALVGVTINAAGLHIATSSTLLLEIALVGLFWLTYSHLLFGVCRVLRGRATYHQSISATLQLFAALYVVGAFATFVLVKAMSLVRLSLNAETTRLVIHFAIVTLLVVVYIPIVLSRLNAFGMWRAIVVSVPSIPVIIALSVVPVLDDPDPENRLGKITPPLACPDCGKERPDGDKEQRPAPKDAFLIAMARRDYAAAAALFCYPPQESQDEPTERRLVMARYLRYMDTTFGPLSVASAPVTGHEWIINLETARDDPWWLIHEPSKASDELRRHGRLRLASSTECIGPDGLALGSIALGVTLPIDGER